MGSCESDCLLVLQSGQWPWLLSSEGLAGLEDLLPAGSPHIAAVRRPQCVTTWASPWIDGMAVSFPRATGLRVEEAV